MSPVTRRSRARDTTTRARIGTAGWPLPADQRPEFAKEGTLLERYASRFTAVEINSSFYRPHRPATYARWAASVPASFRFAVKVPRAITHERRLVDVDATLDAFLAEATALGDRLGCLLVQLPPSLRWDADVADAFFVALRARFDGGVALEPRHPSWFEPEVEAMLVQHRVARVGADPARVPSAAVTGGWPDLAYLRLHGSPRVYYSSYDDGWLDALAERIRQMTRATHDLWCIFDNTAHGAATANALGLARRLGAVAPAARSASRGSR